MAQHVVLKPEVAWAQRADQVLLTIRLSNAQEPQINLTSTGLSFSANAGTASYGFTMEFFGEVNADGATQVLTQREIFLVIPKQEAGPYWPRLFKGSQKEHWVKVDFARWKDEDGEVDENDYDAAQGAGFDMSSMLGGGGTSTDFGTEGFDMAAMMKNMGGANDGLNGDGPGDDDDAEGNGEEDDDLTLDTDGEYDTDGSYTSGSGGSDNDGESNNSAGCGECNDDAIPPAAGAVADGPCSTTTADDAARIAETVA